MKILEQNADNSRKSHNRDIEVSLCHNISYRNDIRHWQKCNEKPRNEEPILFVIFTKLNGNDDYRRYEKYGNYKREEACCYWWNYIVCIEIKGKKQELYVRCKHFNHDK